jgi:hypothetical protein
LTHHIVGLHVVLFGLVGALQGPTQLVNDPQSCSQREAIQDGVDVILHQETAPFLFLGWVTLPTSLQARGRQYTAKLLRISFELCLGCSVVSGGGVKVVVVVVGVVGVDVNCFYDVQAYCIELGGKGLPADETYCQKESRQFLRPQGETCTNFSFFR